MSSGAHFIQSAFNSSGDLFAAAYQGLDTHHIRIVPTSTANELVPQDFGLDRSIKVSAISWAPYPGVDKSQTLKKRKKTTSQVNSIENGEVVLVGTTQGTVLVFSPATNSILNTLKTGSIAPVVSISDMTDDMGQYISDRLLVLQNDSTLTEFDMSRMTLSASSLMPVENPCTFVATKGTEQLIVANTSPYEVKNKDVDIQFNGFATPIRQLVVLHAQGKIGSGAAHNFLALSGEDRQVFIYQPGQPKPIRALVCPTTSAQHVSVAADSSAAAVTTEDGKVHVFDLIKLEVSHTHGANGRSKRGKAVSQIKPSFTVDVRVAKKGTPLVVVNTRFNGPNLQLVWPEQGSVPIFESVMWQATTSTGESTSGVRTDDVRLDMASATPTARENLLNGVDPASAPVFDESHAKVVSGADMADLSESSEGEEQTLADRLEALEVELNKQSDSGSVRNEKNAAGSTTGSASKGGEQTRHSNDTGSGSDSNSRLRRKELQLKLSQPGSFVTLLNQALRLNDKQLLELCLEERDQTMIKTSIVKLDPVFGATLLENLAVIASRSHNRNDTLAQWIRWTVVIHGAYLVTLPNLLRTLAGLHSTLSARAATLPRLLALQGRLELLEEQVAVRSEFAAAQAAADDDADDAEVYFDENDAIIVNGEEANGDEDSDFLNDDAMNDSTGDEEEAEDLDDKNILDADEIMLSDNE